MQTKMEGELNAETIVWAMLKSRSSWEVAEQYIIRVIGKEEKKEASVSRGYVPE